MLRAAPITAVAGVYCSGQERAGTLFVSVHLSCLARRMSVDGSLEAAMK